MGWYSFFRGATAAIFKHHSGPITSVEWHPSDSTVFASAGEDNQVGTCGWAGAYTNVVRVCRVCVCVCVCVCFCTYLRVHLRLCPCVHAIGMYVHKEFMCSYVCTYVCVCLPVSDPLASVPSLSPGGPVGPGC